MVRRQELKLKERRVTKTNEKDKIKAVVKEANLKKLDIADNRIKIGRFEKKLCTERSKKRKNEETSKTQHCLRLRGEIEYGCGENHTRCLSINWTNTRKRKKIMDKKTETNVMKSNLNMNEYKKS